MSDLMDNDARSAAIVQKYGNLSDGVVEALLKEPDGLSQSVKRVTVLSSGLKRAGSLNTRGAPRSEHVEPPDAIIHYSGLMADTVMKNNGFPGHYVGPAVSAMFGAPVESSKHAIDACHAALDMLKNNDLSASSELMTKIGIHTGDAVVGNLGSEQRYFYGMTGDAVENAAALQTATDTYGVKILVSSETKEAVGSASSDFVFRLLDKVILKGKTEVIGVNELVGLKKDVTDEALKGLDLFDQGLKHYFLQEWERAEACLAESKEIEMSALSNSKNNPSAVLYERVQDMKYITPGEGWDGVFVLC